MDQHEPKAIPNGQIALAPTGQHMELFPKWSMRRMQTRSESADRFIGWPSTAAGGRSLTWQKSRGAVMLCTRSDLNLRVEAVEIVRAIALERPLAGMDRSGLNLLSN